MSNRSRRNSGAKESNPSSHQYQSHLQKEQVIAVLDDDHTGVEGRTQHTKKKKDTATRKEYAKEQWRKERDRELKQTNDKESHKQLIKQDHKQMPGTVNQRRLEEEKKGEGNSERTGRRGSESGSMRGTLPKRVTIQTAGETLSRQGKLEGSGSRASIGGPSGPRRQMSQDRVDCSRDGPPGIMRQVSQDRADNSSAKSPGTRRHVSQDRADNSSARSPGTKRHVSQERADNSNARSPGTRRHVSQDRADNSSSRSPGTRRQASHDRVSTGSARSPGTKRKVSQDRVDNISARSPGTRRHVSQDRVSTSSARSPGTRRKASHDKVEMTNKKEREHTINSRPHSFSSQGDTHKKSDPRINERGSYFSLPRRETIEQSRSQREAYLSQEKIIRRENRSIRAEVFSIVLHVFVVATSVMVIVPMSQVAKQWMTTRQRCPLYVYDAIYNTKYWGNPNMAPCNLIAYLPSLVLVISGILILLHIVILHMWRSSGNPPDAAFTRQYAFITLAITCFEFAIIFTVACGISDGFRQTCLVFHQGENWVKGVTPSCKECFDDRDDAYNMVDTHTFNKIITAMVGAWLCSLTTFIIVIVNLSRSRICLFCAKRR